ncbi:MAG: MBL fold metallo-hydrolase, partial [Gammaproteobacteria bacterium]
MLRIEPIPAFQDNYIWCLREGSRAAVVDPGDATPVLQAIQNDELELGAIIITHHHWDHVAGVEELLQHFDVPVFG